MADLAAPVVFEDRSTYRLLYADLVSPRGRLVFGRGSCFDGVDLGEAVAHEYAVAISRSGAVWVREYAEELLGEADDHSSVWIDYDSWPFAVRMTDALGSGLINAHVLGMGVDPLTFATDLLTGGH